MANHAGLRVLGPTRSAPSKGGGGGGGGVMAPRATGGNGAGRRWFISLRLAPDPKAWGSGTPCYGRKLWEETTRPSTSCRASGPLRPQWRWFRRKIPTSVHKGLRCASGPAAASSRGGRHAAHTTGRQIYGDFEKGIDACEWFGLAARSEAGLHNHRTVVLRPRLARSRHVAEFCFTRSRTIRSPHLRRFSTCDGGMQVNGFMDYHAKNFVASKAEDEFKGNVERVQFRAGPP